MTDALESKIAALESKGAHRHDPARFRYIKSLAARARARPGTIAAFAEKKALAAIEAYGADFETARSEAEKILNRIRKFHPDAADVAREHFGNNEFRKVRRLCRWFDRNLSRSALSSLTRRMGLTQPAPAENAGRVSLDDLLRRQEKEVVSSMGSPLAGPGSAQSARKEALRSLRGFKGTMMALQSNRLVTRAVQERPENPGPLNAQMLATRSLVALRQLSPEYLHRFVSHIDTLLWLLQVDTGQEKRETEKISAKINMSTPDTHGGKS